MSKAAPAKLMMRRRENWIFALAADQDRSRMSISRERREVSQSLRILFRRLEIRLRKEIFDEIIKINTLDAKVYEKVQQTIIDALDQGTSVTFLEKEKTRQILRYSYIN